MSEKINTKPTYQRENLIIAELDAEGVITASGVTPDPTESVSSEPENAYGLYDRFHSLGSWF